MDTGRERFDEPDKTVGFKDHDPRESRIRALQSDGRIIRGFYSFAIYENHYRFWNRTSRCVTGDTRGLLYTVKKICEFNTTASTKTKLVQRGLPSVTVWKNRNFVVCIFQKFNIYKITSWSITVRSEIFSKISAVITGKQIDKSTLNLIGILSTCFFCKIRTLFLNIVIFLIFDIFS